MGPSILRQRILIHLTAFAFWHRTDNLFQRIASPQDRAIIDSWIPFFCINMEMLAPKWQKKIGSPNTEGYLEWQIFGSLLTRDRAFFQSSLTTPQFYDWRPQMERGSKRDLPPGAIKLTGVCFVITTSFVTSESMGQIKYGKQRVNARSASTLL